MRFKFTRFITLIVVFANIVVIYYSLKLFLSISAFKNSSQILANKAPPPTKSPVKHVSKLVTIILRDFDSSENDIPATIQSILNVFPNIHIFVVYDTLPYPPMELNTTLHNIKEINLTPALKVPFNERLPALQIKTKYVLFVPDSVRFNSRQLVQTMVSEMHRHLESMLAVVGRKDQSRVQCLRVNIMTRQWSLKYSSVAGGSVCDAIGGNTKHLLMMETDLLKKLPEAFFLPSPQSIYIQTAPLFIKVRILKNLSFMDGKPLFRSHHAQYKQKQLENEQLQSLYRTFQIKQVVKETGNTEWYGCTRDTPRCFGPITDNMPSYLHEGKWTPPCCLSNLRKTAKHVFAHLDEAGIRYWLEAGSLLGAMRSGDILPWDHDVDVGFNRDDLLRSSWLKKAKDRPAVDSKGFLWEKATEGNFYRVHYSKVNKIYVNLFPFYSRNGTMVKDAWFTSHQNMEFPDIFLHPMSSIEFIGRQVPSPNNIRDFLEIKYGKGAIETPQYPDPGKLPFP